MNTKKIKAKIKNIIPLDNKKARVEFDYVAIDGKIIENNVIAKYSKRFYNASAFIDSEIEFEARVDNDGKNVRLNHIRNIKVN